MNHLYGKLNTPLTIKSYTGINTETANTTVDNKNNTIKVDVNTDNIATVDYVNEHIDTFTGEITLSGDEELVLQIQNGRLYHEGELYTGEIVLSDTEPVITLNVQEGFTYFEGNLYTDTVELSGDATLYIVYEKGLVKNITTTNPNLDGTVRYDSEQELTNEEKEVARSNIGLDIDSIARRSVLLLSFGDATYEGKTVKSITSNFRISDNRPRKNSQFYYINEEVPVYSHNYDFEVVGIAVPGMYVNISDSLSYIYPKFNLNLKSGGTILASIGRKTDSSGNILYFIHNM